MKKENVRKAFLEGGASPNEIDALVILQVRLDSFLLILFVIAMSSFRSITKDSIFGVRFMMSANTTLILSLLTLILAFGVGRYLYLRNVRKWIAPHYYNFDQIMIPGLRRYASHLANNRVLFGSAITVLIQQFVILYHPEWIFPSVILAVAILVAVSSVNTGSWKIKDPIVVNGETIKSEQVLASAGRILGEVQYFVYNGIVENPGAETKQYLLDLLRPPSDRDQN
ncbi:MAG: hypothetical protein ACK5ZK_09925 [Armatimonadota bacterium]